MSPSTPY